MAPRRGEDVEGTTDITLEEAYTGTKRTIELSGAGRTRRVEISIPAGVADGARVRAAGQGGAGSSGASAGDLYVRVHVLPHARFTRDGDDLREQVEVPLDVALLGGEVPVRTLRGTTAQLRIPPTTQNGAGCGCAAWACRRCAATATATSSPRSRCDSPTRSARPRRAWPRSCAPSERPGGRPRH